MQGDELVKAIEELDALLVQLKALPQPSSPTEAAKRTFIDEEIAKLTTIVERLRRYRVAPGRVN